MKGQLRDKLKNGRAAVRDKAERIAMNIRKVPKKTNETEKVSKLTDTNTPFAKLTILPSFLGVMIFFIIPFMIVLYYSFLDNPINKNFVFLSNYGILMKNNAFLKSAKNTIVLSVCAVPAAVVFSLMLANLLNSKIPGKSLFRTLFLCPMMVPVASVVLIWQVIFNYNGTLNIILTKLFEMDAVDWMKSDKSLIVVICLFLWKNLGYNMILFLSALGNVPQSLLEVADLEGASSWYKMIHIKLRYISPTIVFVTMMSILNSFRIFREVYLLTGEYPYESLYLLQHFMNNTFQSLDYQKLSSAAILMSAAMIVIISIMIYLDNKFGKDVE